MIFCWSRKQNWQLLFPSLSNSSVNPGHCSALCTNAALMVRVHRSLHLMELSHDSIGVTGPAKETSGWIFIYVSLGKEKCSSARAGRKPSLEALSPWKSWGCPSSDTRENINLLPETSAERKFVVCRGDEKVKNNASYFLESAEPCQQFLAPEEFCTSVLASCMWCKKYPCSSAFCNSISPCFHLLITNTSLSAVPTDR